MKVRIFQKLEKGNKKSPGIPEQEEGGWGGGGAVFFVNVSFFSKSPRSSALFERSNQKLHTKINILFTLLLIIFYQVGNIKSATYLTVLRMPWVE